MYKEVYKGYSPWGGIQHSNIIARGFKAVCTAGHGGYMVTKKFADNYLSDACIKRADNYSGYLCYEEDCCYALVELDLLIHFPEIFKDKLIKKEVSLEIAKNNLIESISCYYPDYLIELGITPTEKQYQIYKDGVKKDKMRNEKHPDLIVSAVSVTKGIVKVWTADKKIHFVEDKSYKDLRKNSNFLLLSKCKEVEYNQQ